MYGEGGGCGSGLGAGGEIMIIFDPLSDFLAFDTSMTLETRITISGKTTDRDMTVIRMDAKRMGVTVTDPVILYQGGLNEDVTD